MSRFKKDDNFTSISYDTVYPTTVDAVEIIHHEMESHPTNELKKFKSEEVKRRQSKITYEATNIAYQQTFDNMLSDEENTTNNYVHHHRQGYHIEASDLGYYKKESLTNPGTQN